MVVRPLTLADTRIGPQLSHNMSGHTTRTAKNIECQKYFDFFEKYDTILSAIFLISLLRITANAVFGPSEVMSEDTPSDTHRYKNSDATPT